MLSVVSTEPTPLLPETKALRAKLEASKLDLDQEAALNGRDLSDAELQAMRQGSTRAASLRRHPVQRPCHKRHFARSRPRTASSARWVSAVPAPRPRAACSACSKRTAACHQSSTI